jgi:hypothetical protein
VLLLWSCGPSLTWTRRAPSTPRNHGCSFDVVDVGPVPPLREIGVIDIDAFSIRGLPRDEASFRRLIAKQVCEVGGEAVIPGINGFGRYVLGTVAVYVKATSFPPVVPREAVKGSADAGSQASSLDGGGAPW